jgi:predicted enzyme related to lactoylglutathione lyase
MKPSDGIHNIEHFEIPSDHAEELMGFYSSLFGWQFEKGQTQDYRMIKSAGISGGLAPREDAEQMPTMFITVESIEDYM